MRKNVFFICLLFALLASETADAQIRRGRSRRAAAYKRIESRLPKFEPTVNLSAGYGFPNTDKIFLPEYYEAYRGGSSQWGPITATLDYQFSRRMSIGVMVTRSSVSAPYYDYFSSSTLPAFTAKLDNWSFMLNMVRHIPASLKATPYMRMAIGINSWKDTYTDPDGNKVLVQSADLPDIAYQAGIGVRLKMSKHTGFFIEAGYGKYVLQAGLSARF
jgi:hypothetical protein